ncbi:MAG: glutamine--fructose-6-phosphate transaminase (isomerizing) [Candidatus Omnitrophica bacterium]|nr:glutamine--fructose-6-phosphate transaminase (isomerizing) [Candidatus Omnitrophota bacterium]MDD5670197.1 glutamine--fructose-6-phosphate transaminase (isomerizing) [Candidatus Omnitrophota bacterium]
MCGIVGYIGYREAVPVLIKGLEHLEYRGYDSAGVAFITQKTGHIHVIKQKGKLARLKEDLRDVHLTSSVGIGHTRWATHGQPSRANAHPHMDMAGQIALVHNGIIENYAALKKELQHQGMTFQSETDTEVAANLIGSYYRKGCLVEALQKAVKRLEGFFAFAVIAKEEPDKLVVFKRSNPLVIGIGRGENFVASDAPAIMPYTNRVVYLEDDEFAILTRQNVQIFSLKTGKRVKRKPTTIHWSIAQAAKGGYPHFMLKEIFEQPRVVEMILKTRLRKGKIIFEKLDSKIAERLKHTQRIHFVSCGTAYHAGLVGSYMLGECLRVPVTTTVSSEFRYGDPTVGKHDLVILITQSGETADTLAAMREAKNKGALTLAIVNVVGSTIAREADWVIYTYAGPEIGVASTKAYLAQLATLALFSIFMAQIHPKGKIGHTKIHSLLRDLSKLPLQITETLKLETKINACAKDLYSKRTFLYLGRGYNYPTALEGALKLKEITYAHAHGYPAGEMKHGPIALIDKNQPVICICPRTSHTYEKMLSNIEEIRARKGIVLSVATRGDHAVQKLSRYTFFITKTEEMFSAVLAAIPIQLFAYKVASLNGRDVDQPRNLAKSVTVE